MTLVRSALAASLVGVLLLALGAVDARERASGAAAFDSVATAPEGPDGWWRLAFADEFSAGSLDVQRWHTCFWWASVSCTIESNHELGLYDADAVEVAGDVARLTARRGDVIGWNGVTYPYSTGMISTGGRKYLRPPGFTFTYGYVEARVRVPAGQGLLPALWLLPASYRSRPEIDVVEILGQEPNVDRMHLHYVAPDGTERDPGAAWRGPDFSAGWHTFGVDWRPDAVVWYVDGVERWRLDDPDAVPAEPMYVVATLAVGGDWPGTPGASTEFPASFDLDYVRVWQRADVPEATVDLVASDASWRYRDDGSDQGAAWRSRGFDDGAWSTGPGTLGYGQGDERTVVGYGPNPASKYVTTYFRRSFAVPDPGLVTSLTLRLRQDDGAVVYLNGTEVFRSNMPAGDVAAGTRAVEAQDDGKLVRTAAVDPSLLRGGRNVIAVEVHQATPSSSDLTMQLELEATTG